MNIINITIPGKPIGKARSGRYGKQYYNTQEDIMNRTKMIIKSQLPKGFKLIPKGVPVIVNIIFFFEPAKAKKTKKFLDLIKNDDYPYLIKPDRDNADKYALDLMSKMVFYDDNQVYDGRITKYYSLNARTEIEIIW